MKLEHLMSGALAAAAVALACGCSSTPAPRTSASAATLSPAVASAVGTTRLMSADVPGPAPKVGKAHLALDGDDADVGASAALEDSTDEASPKDARRSDGSRRGGAFGASK